MPEFCDYEGSDYKQRFWTKERQYEDLVERKALSALSAGLGVAELRRVWPVGRPLCG